MQDHGYPITLAEYHRRVDLAIGAAGRACWPAFLAAIGMLAVGVADEVGGIDLPDRVSVWLNRLFLACLGVGMLVAAVVGDGRAKALGLRCPGCRRFLYAGTLTSVHVATRGTCRRCGVRVLADVG